VTSVLEGPESRLGVGIIGVSPVRGWAATAHIPALRALPNYEIRALSASSAESARAAEGVNRRTAPAGRRSAHRRATTRPPDLVRVAAGVLGGATKVEPPAAGGKTLDATRAAGLRTGIQLRLVGIRHPRPVLGVWSRCRA